MTIKSLNNCKILVIIPARSGSKGIPNKNILNLGGMPLFMHSYNTAMSLSAEYDTNIRISTDSEDYINIFLEYCIPISSISRRPGFLAQDNVRDYPLAVYEFAKAEEETNTIYDLLVWLRPTSPRRDSTLIPRALERLLLSPLSTSLRTFTKPSIHPYRLWSTDSDNVHCTPIVTNVSEAPTVPRQEHPQIYWQQSGDLDITYRETLQSGSMYGEKILPYYLEKPSPDIDMPSDLQSFQ